MQKQRPIACFCSYAQADHRWFQRLRTHLSALGRRERFTLWDEQQILGGENRLEEVLTHLYKADVIILLLSAEFLASRFYDGDEIQQGIQEKMQQGTPIIPIILSDCGWKSTFLESLQALPKNARPIKSWEDKEQALDKVREGIHALLESRWPIEIGRQSYPIEAQSRQEVIAPRESLARLLDMQGSRRLALELMDQSIQTYRALLHSHLSQMHISLQDLFSIYLACVPEDLLRTYAYENASTLDMMLDHLLQAPVDAQAIPALLRFGECCALRFPLYTKLLRDGGEQLAEALALSPQSLVQFRHTLNAGTLVPDHTKQVLPLYLLVVFHTSAEHPMTLNVQAWLSYGHYELDSLNTRPQVMSSTKDALLDTDLLDQMLAEVETRHEISAVAKTHLQIEFFLPRELISSLHVDRWKIRDGTVELGACYSVVVRSLERVFVEKMYQTSTSFWHMKWSEAQALPSGLDGHHIHWVKSAAAYDGESVYYALVDPNKQVVCLCLALTPAASFDRNDKKEFLRMALRAGVPIMFWPKDTAKSSVMRQQFCATLDELLGHSRSAELPMILLKRRWKAISQKAPVQHLDRNLTLLWDDPERLPPDERLQPIAQRR